MNCSLPSGDDDARALVLGGGGVLGFAWTLGALLALEAEWGVRVERSGLIVGTSAGSVLAALLGSGVDPQVIGRHHQGVPAPADPTIVWDHDADTGGSLPPRPDFRLGSPRLLFEAIRHPGQASAAVTLSGLLPRGKASLQPIHDVIAAATQVNPGTDGWPDRSSVWIVATDYENGQRAVFGRDPGSATMADAVAASCAIPGWYSPVEIGGRHYVDGGTASNASVDLVLPLVETGQIREVFVLAPMASVEFDRPRSPMARLERVVRRAVTRGIQADVDGLRRAGARVVLLTPGPLDLDAMGANLMNPRLRGAVLETSLLTSASALRVLRIQEAVADIPDDAIAEKEAG